LVLICRGLGDAADRTLQPRAYRGRKRKPIALEGAIVGTACGATVLADPVCSCASPIRIELSLVGMGAEMATVPTRPLGAVTIPSGESGS
jgi:hypothetical protein